MTREKTDGVPTASLGELLRLRAAEDGDRNYLEDARSTTALTYAQTLDAVSSFIAGAGLPARTTVFIDESDPLVFAVAHLGAVAAGHRSVPLDPALAPDDIARLAKLVDGPKVLVTAADARAAACGVDRIAPPQLDGGPGRRPEASVFRPDGSAMLFTSGSTGTPKGVELGADQLLFVGAAVADHLRLTPEDRGYNSLPLFHINAEVVGLLSTLSAGSTLVLDRRFHRTGFWPLMAQRDISWINAVPAILAVLATEPIAAPQRLRLIRTASAPLPGPVADAFDGIPLVVSYGMTEASSQITATPVNAPRHGTVGVPVGTEVEVRDGGTAVSTGTVGELWIRGPGVVTSYFGGAAADRFDADGWLRTGDLGSLDDDGYVTLAGRVDDVINRGGEKVYPLEVEEVLLIDSEVREVVVVGAPDDVLGFVPVAFVIPAERARSDEQERTLVERLAALAEERLPRFKRPRTITVVDDVPRAATGKVQRVRLRSAIADSAANAE
ncbi:class I adenylate-forming enzyme family protein [Humibacter sp. RRB41]|uniref:class I adenylate-forming enzyme family protein n=1 Tax=Humibacter sp. RRB41 TaxID=2919946 RepID=UPI001FAA1BB7|nr:AMP-binding protein [Humibacter sp. RRB41]